MNKKSQISDIELIKSNQESYSLNENIPVNIRFSALGELRDAFNEKNWTESYNNNDVSFKLKYDIKIHSGSRGILAKNSTKNTINSYRKASIFWTRNPKLVNPMKDRRIWVQVAKNFEPIIRLTEEEIKQELFDFDEKITINASDLGVGKHKITAEVSLSWQKHDYIDAGNLKANSDKEIEIVITN